MHSSIAAANVRTATRRQCSGVGSSSSSSVGSMKRLQHHSSSSSSARPRRVVGLRATQQQGGGNGGGDSDLAFVAKGVLASFAGAAAIKYGSLLFELPQAPDARVAAACVALPPALYAVLLLARGGGGDSGK